MRDSTVSPHPFIVWFYLQPDKVLYWLRELLSGLLFLEKNCVVHRDLKMENLLLSQDGKLVIADFGKAILLDDNFKIPYVQGNNISCRNNYCFIQSLTGFLCSWDGCWWKQGSSLPRDSQHQAWPKKDYLLCEAASVGGWSVGLWASRSSQSIFRRSHWPARLHHWPVATAKVHLLQAV